MFDRVGCRRVKMTRLRMRVADRLKGAQNTYAMLTTFNEVDMTGIMQLRTDYKVGRSQCLPKDRLLVIRISNKYFPVLKPCTAGSWSALAPLAPLKPG